MKRLAILAALCSVAALYGCPSDTVAVNVKMVTPAGQTGTLDGVNYLSMTITGQDIPAPLYNEYDYTAGSASVPGVPLSKGVRVTIQAFSDGSIDTSTLAARGISAPFDLTGDSDSMDVTVLVSRVNAFAQTTDLTQPPDAGGNLTASYLPAARQAHTSTLLPDGKVLIAGGFESKSGAPFYSGALTIYDPGTGTFADLPGQLNFPRAFHTATLVNYGSTDAPEWKVLIAGGIGIISQLEQSLTTAEVFDVTTQVVTDQLFQSVGRAYHTATLMGNGDVVLIGGNSKEPSGPSSTVDHFLDNAEVFDIASKQFTAVQGAMSVARAWHTSTYLVITQNADTGVPINEKVLVYGGRNDKNVWSTAELYTHDPRGRGFNKITTSDGTEVHSNKKRWGHSAGRVIVSSSADPRDATAVRNDNIKVVFAGGYQCIKGCPSGTDCCGTAGGFTTLEGSITNSAEIFDPFTGYIGSFVAETSLKLGVAEATMSDLPERKLLLAGGKDANAKPRQEAELFIFSDKGVLAKPDFTASKMTDGRYEHSAVTLDSGMVLITGGYGANGSLDSAEIYSPVYPVVIPTQ